jgi:hypothetical protein
MIPFLNKRIFTLRKAPLLLMSIAMAAFTLPAWGVLGGNVSSVQDDQTRLKGTLQVTKAAGYEIHEIQTEQGVKVREFVSAGGTVFGVAWEGPWKPNMRQLLGSYFDQYMNAVPATKTTHGPVTVQSSGLVVHLAGHPGAFVGQAYLTQMIPQSASAAVIK